MKPKPKAKSLKSKKKQKESKGKPHRFKKGESGNPKGRRLGSKSLKGAFEAVASLDYGPVTFPGGITRELTGTEKIAKRVYDEAKRGSLRAVEMFFDRLYGKLPLAIKQLGDGTGRVNINITRHIKDTENPDVEIKTERTDPKEEGKNP